MSLNRLVSVYMPSGGKRVNAGRPSGQRPYGEKYSSTTPHDHTFLEKLKF
jgi:hypothetical protein